MCQRSLVVRDRDRRPARLGGRRRLHSCAPRRARRSGVRVKAVVTRSDPRPPRFARWLLRLRPLGSRRSEIDADLHEAFIQRAARDGRIRAVIRYYVDVFSVWRWNPSGGRTMRDVIQDLTVRPARVPPQPGSRRDHDRRPRARHRRQHRGLQPAQRNDVDASRCGWSGFRRPRRARVERWRLTRMVVRRVPRAARHLA